MRRSMIGLLVANGISLLGSRMSLVALPWFVLVSTGSAARTGLVAFAEMLPYVVACGLGGPIMDRVGHRRVSIAADFGSALAVAAIPLVGFNFSVLVGLVAVAGGLRGFGDTSKRVLFRQAVAASGVDVTRATSVNDGINRLSTLLGAPIAGVLIAAFDAGTVLIADAATFLAGAAIIAVVVGARTEAGERRPYLRALGEGVAFLRQEKLVGGLLLVFFASNLLDAAWGSVLIPLWANEVVGSAVALGLVSASFGLGAVLGNIAFTAIAPRVPRFAAFACGFLFGGAPRFFVPAFVDDPWPMYAVCFVTGVSMAAINPIIGAVMFERVPPDMLARVQGVGTAVAWGGIPLGSLIGGWLGEWSLTGGLVLMGTGFLGLTAVLYSMPIWRQVAIKPSIGAEAGAVPRSRDSADHARHA